MMNLVRENKNRKILRTCRGAIELNKTFDVIFGGQIDPLQIYIVRQIAPE